jgi:spore coat polysaccharide biosynthesis protein SpsF
MVLPSAVIGVQCRISSSRLPCKALLELADTTILGMCLERAKNAGYPVFLLTSDHEEDDLIAESALKYGVAGVIRGSLDNVLSRYVSLVENASFDYIVRVTADNPLTEYNFVNPLIDHALSNDLPYVWVEPSLCPEGTNLEVFSKKALLESFTMDKSRRNLEHVTHYMRRNLSSRQCLREAIYRDFPFDCSQLSFTVDTISDYVRLVKLFSSVLQELSMNWRSPEFVRYCAEFASNNSSYYATGRHYAIR